MTIKDETLINKKTVAALIKANEPVSIDQIIDYTISICVGLPHECEKFIGQINELRSRLSQGRLHLAVLGQFNRGKSTFVNALIGHKLLPASVLPVTSVPTLIAHGHELSLKVKFLTKKNNLLIESSKERITEALLTYVAEENNPKNQLCVEYVELKIPSPLLENGTVLIDTPGIGSSYIHNTKTTIDLLHECDAALFLLSADTPLTHTEIEFIREAKRHIKKIFLILNKVDLLSPQEISSVREFIGRQLSTQPDLRENLKIFNVSSSLAVQASVQSLQDKNWNESGMETVKAEILEFLIREKYFTLADALNSKLADAIHGIILVLQREISFLHDPIHTIQTEKDEFTKQIEVYKKNVEKELSLIAIEQQAILKFLGEQIDLNGIEFESNLKTSIEEMVESAIINEDSLNQINTAVFQIIDRLLESFVIKLIALVNKPLRKAVVGHAKEFIKITSAVKTLLAEQIDEVHKIADSLEKFEIELSGSNWEKPELDLNINLKLTFSEKLKKKEFKRQMVTSRFLQKTPEINTFCKTALKEYLHKEIISSCNKIHTTLSKDYNDILTVLEKIVDKKQTRLEKKSNESYNSITSLSNLKDELGLLFDHVAKR